MPSPHEHGCACNDGRPALGASCVVSLLAILARRAGGPRQVGVPLRRSGRAAPDVRPPPGRFRLRDVRLLTDALTQRVMDSHEGIEENGHC
jgi:hypothetical protein